VQQGNPPVTDQMSPVEAEAFLDAHFKDGSIVEPQ
jgi:hypothetical protein